MTSPKKSDYKYYRLNVSCYFYDNVLVDACASLGEREYELEAAHVDVLDTTSHGRDVTNDLLPKYQDKLNVQPSTPSLRQLACQRLH